MRGTFALAHMRDDHSAEPICFVEAKDSFWLEQAEEAAREYQRLILATDEELRPEYQEYVERMQKMNNAATDPEWQVESARYHNALTLVASVKDDTIEDVPQSTEMRSYIEDMHQRINASLVHDTPREWSMEIVSFEVWAAQMRRNRLSDIDSYKQRAENERLYAKQTNAFLREAIALFGPPPQGMQTYEQYQQKHRRL